METLQRNNYYCNVIMEVREIFINYGRYLEKNGISGQGDIEDYERYLCQDEEISEDQEDEEFRELCLENNMKISQRDREYEEFLNFIVENGKDGWDNDIAIYKKEDYDSGRFDKVIYCKADDVYDVIGIDIWEFEKCFVSTTYIENLDVYRVVVNICDVNKEFVIHGV